MSETEALDAGLPMDHRIRLAYDAARNRQDVGGVAGGIWQPLDALWAKLQSRLHAVERMRGDPNVTRAQLAAEEAKRPKILADALAEFQRWRDMDLRQIPAALGALNPPAPLPSPEARAAMALADMRRRGFRFREAHKGELKVEPGSGLTDADRSFVAAHKDHILKAVRSEDDSWTV